MWSLNTQMKIELLGYKMNAKTIALLKRSKFLSWINSSIKSRAIKKNYQYLVDKYKNIAQAHTLDELMERKGFSAEWALSKSNRKLKVYFIGTDEYQDKSGFIQDLAKVADLTYFTKYDGAYGQYSGLLLYKGGQGRKLNTDKAIEDIDSLIVKGSKPDIVLMQAWGRSFDIDRLQSYKNKHDLKLVNIALDDRLVSTVKTPKGEKYNYGISGLNTLIDLSLVSNPEVVEWYIKEGVPSIFFPMASSLDFYYPMVIDKKYDVGFIGNKYGFREELVTRLLEEGIEVEARGTGWPAGRIELKENNQFFNECKIILGIGTVGHCKDFYTQKLRDFDATLSGGVYVTHNNPDLKLFFEEDEEILLCDNIGDYVRKIKSLLVDETRMKAISRNAYIKASENHTYESRFLKLFDFLGIRNDMR